MRAGGASDNSRQIYFHKSRLALARVVCCCLMAVGMPLTLALPAWTAEKLPDEVELLPTWQGQLQDGKYISDDDLGEILLSHALWIETDGKEGRFADLAKANLQWANLQGVDLPGAKLHGANLEHAFLSWANLHGVNLDRALLKRANLIATKLHRANLQGANFEWANLSLANLQGAQLLGAHLRKANLQGAKLWYANLDNATLDEANLKESILVGANLTGAFLGRADLQEADLQGADLKGADLQGANMQGTKLIGTNLQNVNLYEVKLAGAIFEPKAGFATSLDGLASIRGLAQLSFENSSHALSELRAWYKTASLREQERQVTYAIRHSQVTKGLDKSWLESGLSYVAFDLTCAWGMEPFRPLGIMTFLMFGPFWLAYFLFAFPSVLPNDGEHGIWRVWPGTALYRDPEKDKTSPLQPESGWKMLWFGLYFSLLSAFHIGWRDLNVGAWISRIFPKEYTLRATGWVRVVSGLQSLISVYLLALCILSYFGRPFE